MTKLFDFLILHLKKGHLSERIKSETLKYLFQRPKIMILDVIIIAAEAVSSLKNKNLQLQTN